MHRIIFWTVSTIIYMFQSVTCDLILRLSCTQSHPSGCVLHLTSP